MSGHDGIVQFVEANWLWIVIWCWVLGAFSAAGETWRRVARHRRKAAGLRHKRRVELELARSGLVAGKHGKVKAAAQLTMMMPAAVIPSPPGAMPVTGVPGACRHERILPVITRDGDVVRWICANYQRCDAEFPPDTAIYEPGDDE